MAAAKRSCSSVISSGVIERNFSLTGHVVSARGSTLKSSSDERNQVLTSHIWLDQEWYDDKLKWDPVDYNGLKTLRVACHLIWKPDIVFYNSADDYINGYMPALAMVSHDGHVFWPPVVHVRSTCKIDITYFPFDDQMCSLKVGSWAYDGLQVDVQKRDKPIDLENYITNGEWELINAKVVRHVAYYACCPEPYPDVRFTLHIRRRTLYYTYNIIIPCIMLSSLSLLGFWIPPEGGEKVGLGLTVLLAYSVFMLLIAESMPATSFYIPLIGIYIIVAMALTCITVVCSVIVSHIHHQGNMGRPVPDYLKTIAHIIKTCLCLFDQKQRKKSKLSSTSSRENTTSVASCETTPDQKTPLSSSGINFSQLSGCRNCHQCLEFENIHTTGANSSLHRVNMGDNELFTNHANYVTVTASADNKAKVTVAAASVATTGVGMRRNMAPPTGDGVGRANAGAHARCGGRQADRSRPDEKEAALYSKLDAIADRQEELIKIVDSGSGINKEWHELAETIDRGFFWVYTTVTILITVIILLIVPLGKAVTI
ncbi:hypothetical protein LSH36_581g04044 [Paralvinella palmiformis]|uniref:Uncharacterized protein n=1 Tax=Paralvinella palmiformis TaxID=53620 RepID=A0AAD9J5A1_9ANNE|nr:hypothetical protein LSH36_581g04044 [Paralvinella palmiformis]